MVHLARQPSLLLIAQAVLCNYAVRGTRCASIAVSGVALEYCGCYRPHQPLTPLFHTKHKRSHTPSLPHKHTTSRRQSLSQPLSLSALPLLAEVIYLCHQLPFLSLLRTRQCLLVLPHQLLPALRRFMCSICSCLLLKAEVIRGFENHAESVLKPVYLAGQDACGQNLLLNLCMHAQTENGRWGRRGVKSCLAHSKHRHVHQSNGFLLTWPHSLMVLLILCNQGWVINKVQS